MKKIIEKITKITEKMQATKIRYFAKLPIDEKVEIFDKTTNLFHKLKQQYTDIPNSILTYISFIIIISAYKNDEEILKNANFKELSLEEIYQLCQKRIKIFKNSIKRRSLKNEKIIEHWAIIKELRAQNVSYRQISEYLHKYNNFKISSTKIYQKWKEMNDE